MVDDFTNINPTTKTAPNPAASHLFKVNEEAEVMDEKREQTFRKYVAKSLFAIKRARPDIHTAVAFLTTRVMTPNEDDWKKLLRIINYLRGTLKLPLTLQVSNTNIVKSLDFTTAGQVQVNMFNYIKEVVDDFKKINRTTNTAPNPAASHLFKVNEEA